MTTPLARRLYRREQAERAEAAGADVTRREDLLVEACMKYDAAYRLRPRSHSTLYNWARNLPSARSLTRSSHSLGDVKASNGGIHVLCAVKHWESEIKKLV